MHEDARAPAPDRLLAWLQALEMELHHPGVPCTRERLEQLLHPAFHEVGRSGRRYDRAAVIGFLASHPSLPVVESRDFSLERLGEGLALLTFESRRRHADGSESHPTRRASLWVHDADGWQLRYHQGTPAATAD